MLNIVTAERLRHVVEASKTALEGGGLGKPSGVRGVQLWRKIGDPAPVNESELEFVNEFTRARMTLDYQMSQGGQTVYYQARWVSTRGETGPWGELVSATVVKWASLAAAMRSKHTHPRRVVGLGIMLGLNRDQSRRV